MDKKTKILYAVFFAAIIFAVGASYYKYFVAKDYFVKMETECDPMSEVCFVFECDPESDPECPAEVEERVSYYKYVNKKAFAIPLCDPENEECASLQCSADEDCEEIFCSEETVDEGTTCNDPGQYARENAETGGELGDDDGDLEENSEAGAEGSGEILPLEREKADGLEEPQENQCEVQDGIGITEKGEM